MSVNQSEQAVPLNPWVECVEMDMELVSLKPLPPLNNKPCPGIKLLMHNTRRGHKYVPGCACRTTSTDMLQSNINHEGIPQCAPHPEPSNQRSIAVNGELQYTGLAACTMLMECVFQRSLVARPQRAPPTSAAHRGGGFGIGCGTWQGLVTTQQHS